MASSSSLKSKIASLKGDLKNKKERLSTVKKVKSNLEKKYDDDITDFNSYLSKVTNGLEGGIYNNKTAIENHDFVDKYREKGDTSDSKLSAAETSLQNEINKLEGEISDIEAEIKQAERDYNNAVAAEKAAAQRAAEQRAAEQRAAQQLQQKAAQQQEAKKQSSTTNSLSSSKRKVNWWPF